ncbi:MAG: signal peptide peptidase SppA, partial [Nitrospirae bacterium]|nr:signal peptide peptidase SppA [Nitrospirota bacterium]
VVFFVLAYLFTVFFGKSSCTGDKIAVVRIEGVILDSQQVLTELKEYRENPSVKAILLRIDSPGGAVAPSQEIYEEVKKIRDGNRKKVVASMGSVAASGGYYIASAAHKIVANPGTITGSIGVIMELANVSGLLKKVGVESVVIKSGKYKDVGSAFRAMTPEERTMIQGVMDDVHEQFIDAVSTGRRMDAGKVREIADGRVFSGKQAQKLGLVDELGNYEDAIQTASKLAGIRGEPRIIEKKAPFSFLDIVTGQTSLAKLMGNGQTGSFFKISYLFSF